MSQHDRDPETGQFLPGNRFWEARSSHGRKPKFESSEILWDACRQYFAWAEENPLWEAKAFAFQGVVTIGKLPKMRAMTISGLCTFIDVAVSTWDEWKTSRPDFSEVINATETVIRDQKFAGASADLLNANIIARDLGLSDKREVEGGLTVNIVDSFADDT